MTLLPLLYPEVFQRFSLTPPHRVLFTVHQERERRYWIVLSLRVAAQMVAESVRFSP